MDTQTKSLLQLANHYPSPHNGQPIRIHPKSKNILDLYFVRERGLRSSDISYLFSYASMGVFVEHLRSCGKALGHKISIDTKLPKIKKLSANGPILFATAKISWNASRPDKSLQKLIETRQTSRKNYTKGPTKSQIDSLMNVTKNSKLKTHVLNKQQSKQAIWLNQRAVFDDLFNQDAREELDSWLRYNKKEKTVMKDGLSYDCMCINGTAMRFVVHHPKILKVPGLSFALKQYYLRTMQDSSTVMYMTAPFETEQESYVVGEYIMKFWFECSKNNLYIHPFGTIMSNHEAHRDFIKLSGIKKENPERSYLVFITRIGKSDPPALSERLPFDQHLLMKDEIK